MKIIEVNKKITKTANSQHVEERIKKEKKEYYRPMKGRFEFLDAQGGWVDFTDRPFPNEPIMQYHIDHGEICELPAGLVKRLNNTKKIVRGYDMNCEDPNKQYGRIPPVVDKISRVNFIPTEFLYQEANQEAK